MASRIRTRYDARLSIVVACLLLLAVTAVAAALVTRPPSAAAADTLSASAAESTVPVAQAAPGIRARSGILIDRRTGRVLWSKDADMRLAPASCTKIMTALLVLERYSDLERMVRAPAIVTEHQTVAIGLRPGDRISVKQALRALMTKSANDACVTLATAVGGSETGFVKLMNRRAAQLGLTRTRFVNARGTPKPGHYASARDLARLGRYAMRDARFRDLVGTKTRVITWPPSHRVTVTSHNRLLDYPWGDGIKTGSTKQSLRVLVGSGKPGLVPLIVVTMREPTRDQEEEDAIALLTWGSALYESRQIVAAGEVVRQVQVSGDAPVDVVAGAGLTAIIRKAATPTVLFDLPQEPLPARPPDGAKLGTVTYRSDGLVLGRVDLLAATPAGSAGQ
jgi:D-alanyl-D-alanine carboxypeptidase (penicillin-binding protein 5/6)